MTEVKDTTFKYGQQFTLTDVMMNLSAEKGAHLLYMFNELDKYLENTLTFISDGLDNGDSVIFIEDENLFITIKKKLKLRGYSTEALHSIKFCCNREFYRPNETFDAKKTSKKLVSILEEEEKEGIQTRIWGHVIIDNASISELRKYESESDKSIYEKNILTVCVYNALTTPAFFQNELLKVHEYLMLDGEIVKSPLYNRNYLVAFSPCEKERLLNLEKENYLLKEKNEKLLIDTARQREKEKYLKLAKMNADKANKAKSLFLSQMSHDLRTPLNTIQGYAQIIQMNDELNGAKDLHKKVNKIYHASEQLLKLIEGILDFSSIDTGRVKINKEKIQLKGFLEDTVGSLLETNLTDIHIELQCETVDEGVYIEVDPLRFNQILTNLLDNAIKYNHPGGTVKIYCNHDEQRKEITIHVQDTGIGIPKDETAFIFDPFFRTTSTTADWDGTGLGLAIVAQLTKRMNGNYGVTTEEGIGSTFWVSFHKVDAPPTFGTDAPGVQRDLFNLDAMKVLYIEDNGENIEVMKSMLEFIGNVEMTCVTTGRDGLEKAFELRPSLILLDLSLPDISGFEVLNKLKSNPVTKDIPIAAVSADALESTIKKALIEGCNAYITKPINFEELREVLETRARLV